MITPHLKVVGIFQTNCWVIESGEDALCAVVDPGFSPRKIWQMVQQLQLKVKFILLTHGHMDHTLGVRYLRRKSKAPCLMHPADRPYQWRWFNFAAPKCVPVEDGQSLKLGGAEIKVIHTPGHSPGSVSYLVNNFLFSGDLLFADGIGRWDLAGGSFREIVKSLKEKLGPLPDSVEIMPGHGPVTTLGIERSRNPILGSELQNSAILGSELQNSESGGQSRGLRPQFRSPKFNDKA